MRRLHTLTIGLASGLLAGLVAGIGARIAMRMVADSINRFPELTPDGTLLVLIVGTLLGAPLGAAYVALQPRLPGPPVVRGLVFGLILLGSAGLPLWALPPSGELVLAPGLGRMLFGGLIAGFGVLLALAEHYLARIVPAPRRHPASLAGHGILLLAGALGAMLFVSAFIGSIFPHGE